MTGHEDKPESKKNHAIIGVIGSKNHSKTTLMAAIEKVCQKSSQVANQECDNQETDIKSISDAFYSKE